MKWAYSVGGFLEVGGWYNRKKNQDEIIQKKKKKKKEEKAGVKAARGAAQLVVWDHSALFEFSGRGLLTQRYIYLSHQNK